MKHLFTFLFLLCAACTNVLAQTTEADILKLEDRLRAARLNSDVAELEKLTDPDMQIVNQLSARNSRAPFLTNSRTFKPSEITHSGVKVLIAGDTAIVSGDKREITPNTAGRPQFLHFMHTWVKRADGWKLLVMQQQFDIREGMLTPAGWNGQSNAFYLIGTDTDIKRSGNASLFIKSKHNEDRALGTGVGQVIKADAYRGNRVKLTGYVKGHVEYGVAYPWFRVNAEHEQGAVLSFDNRMSEGFFVRPDWNQFSIVLDVPETSGAISLGFVLSGRGRVWLDDWQIEIVSKDTPSTSLTASEALQKQMAFFYSTTQGKQEIENAKKRQATLPTAFTNLDFEAAGKP